MESSDSDVSISKKIHKCTHPGCNAAFSKNNKLIVHNRKHTGERPFVCDEPGCDKTYTNNSHLRRHKKVSHTEKIAQSVTCDFEGCGAVLANKYSLKKHFSRRHNSELYPFICHECSQGFDRKKQLQQHVYLHTGVASFSCDKCDMSFATSHSLNKHKRSHREYTCECGQTFHRWSLILKHRKSCRKPRFTCEDCDKSFSHRGNYVTHQLTHKDKSDKLVFCCPYKDCKRFYFHKKNLKAHILTFHKKINEGQRFKCTYPKCKVVLKTKRLQKLHLQRHFEWKKKRKTRIDKGTTKKSGSIISELVGKPKEVQFDPKDTSSAVQEDDPILKECELTLQLLHEQMVAVN